MQDSKCLAAVQRWIESCPGLAPLEACVNHAEQQALTALIDSHPNLRGSWMEAVLGLRIGSIDRPHEIVQQGLNSMDRYLHGVVHRMEGDFWNSKYWFRQVNDRKLLASIGCGLIEALKMMNVERSQLPKIFDDEGLFFPTELVDAQAAFQAKFSQIDRALLQQIVHCEWESLWKLCQNR